MAQPNQGGGGGAGNCNISGSLERGGEAGVGPASLTNAWGSAMSYLETTFRGTLNLHLWLHHRLDYSDSRNSRSLRGHDLLPSYINKKGNIKIRCTHAHTHPPKILAFESGVLESVVLESNVSELESYSQLCEFAQVNNLPNLSFLTYRMGRILTMTLQVVVRIKSSK